MATKINLTGWLDWKTNAPAGPTLEINQAIYRPTDREPQIINGTAHPYYLTVRRVARRWYHVTTVCNGIATGPIHRETSLAEAIG